MCALTTRCTERIFDRLAGTGKAGRFLAGGFLTMIERLSRIEKKGMCSKRAYALQ
jgi:hypothetical protein